MNDMHRITLSAAVLLAAVPAGAAAWKVATLYWDRPVRHGAALLIAVSLALFAWALLVMPMSPILAASLLLALTLVTLTAIDVVVFRLPDPLTLPLVVVGLIVSAWLPDGRLVDHLIGAVAGYGLLAAFQWGFERLRGYEGIGLGDAKLLAASGAWLGWSPLPSVLLIACAAAFLQLSLMTIIQRRSAFRDRLAFGGPLCLATWIVWLHGPLVS